MNGPPPRKVYPGHADYDMAVENLHQFVFDSVLKAGRPKLRRDGRPLYYQGGFAKAYVIECQGKTYALRVWLSDIGDAAHRYDAVSKYCGQTRLPFFVDDFTYVHDGILVNGQRYPLLRMAWVEGMSLVDFIKGHLNDTDLLRAAAGEFLSMVRTLHRQGVAHGDLQSDNMMVSKAPGGAVTFKLIDYDTLMVPDLQGWTITSKGLPSYQHPRRDDSVRATVRDDYFSELVIYLSLLAVAETPNLWLRHPAPQGKRDKELLFVPEDFTAEHPTPVFRALQACGGQVRMLADALWNFTRKQSIDQLLPLEEVLGPVQKAPNFDRLLKDLMGSRGAPSALTQEPAGTREERVVPPVGARAVEWAKAEPGAFRSVDLGSGVSLLLCGIPAGTFEMGGSGSGGKQHEVTLSKPFWLGRTQVTQAQWKAVMGTDPSYFKGNALPVDRVSWYDATIFCAKLNGRNVLPAGWKWVLPTEAQWEYACRAAMASEHAWDLDAMAWYSSNSGGRTRAVATKSPNPWGLHDMHGNVWEWCADWWGAYPPGVVINPTGPNSGSDRVFRGGSWFNVGTYCAATCRSGDKPDRRHHDIGFRVAAVPVEWQPAVAAAVVSGVQTTVELAAPLAGTGAAESARAAAVALRSVNIGSGATLLLCSIPAGTFRMGGTDADCKQHQVTLSKPFWLGRTQVTQAQWKTIMGGNPSFFKGDDFPVERVSWHDAAEFCENLNLKKLLPTGWRWVLPTEAQWEYACRAGTTGEYAGDLKAMAWYAGNSDGQTHSVGAKQANSWGVCDMHGNVWEWCADWHAEYPDGAVADPTGPDRGSFRVYRGGSWLSVGSFCRSTSRDRNSPGYLLHSVGFRVAAVPGGS